MGSDVLFPLRPLVWVFEIELQPMCVRVCVDMFQRNLGLAFQVKTRIG